MKRFSHSVGASNCRSGRQACEQRYRQAMDAHEDFVAESRHALLALARLGNLLGQDPSEFERFAAAVLAELVDEAAREHGRMLDEMAIDLQPEDAESYYADGWFDPRDFPLASCSPGDFEMSDSWRSNLR